MRPATRTDPVPARLALVRDVHARLGGTPAGPRPFVGDVRAARDGDEAGDVVADGPAAPVPLTPARPDDGASLRQALARRRSCYSVTAGPLHLTDVSDLLRTAVGVQRRVPGYGRHDHPLGVAPSAGGLRSLDVHVLATRVEGLAAGAYRYRWEEQDLLPRPLGHRPDGRPVDLVEALEGVYLQREFARAAATVALVARLDRVLAKYPARHYRTVHVDAGVALQNLYLWTAVAPGVGGCAVAGFDDRAADGLLGLENAAFTAVLFAVGPDGSR